MYKRLHFLFAHLFGILRDKRQKLLSWFWLLLGYFVSQGAIQALNLVAGIVIIRSLSKDDYASYTIVNTMGPALVLLADNGICVGLFAIGRKIWKDDERMGGLVRTGLNLRRLFGLISFALVSPILAWMLYRNHVPVETASLLLIVTLMGVWSQLVSGVMKIVMELRQQIASLLKVGLAMAILRFVLIASFAGLFLINAVLATLAATCAFVLEAVLLVGFVQPQIKWGAPEEPAYRSEILTLIRRTAPLTIYFCIQTQISIWLISIFGNSHQVADIGAITRIGMIFSMLGSAYGTIIVPRFSRNDGRQRLLIQVGQILGSYLAILMILVILTGIFPPPLGLLLGTKYANLNSLTWLVVLSSGLGSFLGLVFALNRSKGWIPPAGLTIFLEIITQVILLLSLDLSKSRNVIIFSALSTVSPIILNLMVLFRQIRREN